MGRFPVGGRPVLFSPSGCAMSNRRTALYHWHAAHKARIVPFAGWDMPVQYTGIIDEHKAVRTAAGLFDVSHMARLCFGGPDALALLETVFTNSVATMKDFQVRYGLVCNEAGGILDDVLVYRWPYGYAMVVNASNREKIVAWLATARGRQGRADPGPDRRDRDGRRPGAEGGRAVPPGCSTPTWPT